MKFTHKHRRVVEKHIAEHRQYVTLDGEIWSVAVAAKQMGIKVKKKDKYRTEHADLERVEPRRDIEDSGDGTSESEE